MTFKIAYVNLVVIRISVDNSCASFKKRRSEFIDDILSEIKINRIVDLIVICNI